MSTSRRLAVVAVGAGALGTAALVRGFRTRDPRLLGPLLAWQRRSMNPRNLRTAGQPGAPWAVVRHTGRVSGRAYATPVGATRVPDGFAVMLPYGPGTDWVRNILAAGRAELELDGRRYAVTAGPDDVVPAGTVSARAGVGDLLAMRVLGVREALLLRVEG
ncbi:nitroreductase family deazaflavin-dependent oxidoreductase [Serinicoccus kebangsaanensis]|uniref:nitroreductase family deazaflavin-dependent oxidoreductase n=1 Tax=Serinicoccus kebangsaanensis TaxID=2602069 RepID=UPI001EE1ECFD|nr:nitroreductase family deazaflavin-dependent oxidoreductase [Serinicoccus kebangsaanensis]